MYRLSKLIIILDINNTSNSGELQNKDSGQSPS